MFDYSKLAGRIVEIMGTRTNFAKALGVSEHTISFKMCGKKQWTQREMYQSSVVLGFSTDEIPAYFFRPKVQRSQLDDSTSNTNQ